MRVRGLLLGIAVCCLTFGVGQAAMPVDSQVVLARYALAIDGVKTPKAVILNYAISQSGPSMIDEHHILYRSGLRVRDETLSVGGSALRQREIHIGSREDRYALTRIAPRADAYGFVFLKAVHRGAEIAYLYDAVPLVAQSTGFVVNRVMIDAKTSLPLEINFSTGSGSAHGRGMISYARMGAFWMPTLASITATISGKSARETISFSAYRFPTALPNGTFLSPKPLPQLSLPTF